MLYPGTMFGPDGLYGSKHRAAVVNSTEYWAEAGPWCQAGPASHMDRIDLLFLLDLIGNNHVTQNQYKRLHRNNINSGLIDEILV